MIQGVSEWVHHPWPVMHWVILPLSWSEVGVDVQVLLVAVLVTDGSSDGVLPESYHRLFHFRWLSWPFILVEVWLHLLSLEG